MLFVWNIWTLVACLIRRKTQHLIITTKDGRKGRKLTFSPIGLEKDPDFIFAIYVFFRYLASIVPCVPLFNLCTWHSSSLLRKRLILLFRIQKINSIVQDPISPLISKCCSMCIEGTFCASFLCQMQFTWTVMASHEWKVMKEHVWYELMVHVIYKYICIYVC